MTTDRPTIHRAALAPLNGDYLSTRTPPIADWIERHAPGAFQRLYVVDAENPHVLVPVARWNAQSADVLGIEAEVAHERQADDPR
jgi:hypothetical protein